MAEVDLKSKLVWASGLKVEEKAGSFFIFDPDSGQALGEVADEELLVVFVLGYLAGIQKAVRRKV